MVIGHLVSGLPPGDMRVVGKVGVVWLVKGERGPSTRPGGWTSFVPLGPGGRELEWRGQRGQSVEQGPEDPGERATAIHVVMGGLEGGLPLIAWVAPPQPPCRVRHVQAMGPRAHLAGSAPEVFFTRDRRRLCPLPSA